MKINLETNLGQLIDYSTEHSCHIQVNSTIEGEAKVTIDGKEMRTQANYCCLSHLFPEDYIATELYGYVKEVERYLPADLELRKKVLKTLLGE